MSGGRTGKPRNRHELNQAITNLERDVHLLTQLCSMHHQLLQKLVALEPTLAATDAPPSTSLARLNRNRSTAYLTRTPISDFGAIPLLELVRNTFNSESVHDIAWRIGA